MADGLRGGVSDPRVAVEYNSIHERAGSIRMYETLPLFTGRSTLEGVYNQASLTTHSVYYLASELGAASPNPFKEIEYSRFDTPAALAHLRLFNVEDVVALFAPARHLPRGPGRRGLDRAHPALHGLSAPGRVQALRRARPLRPGAEQPRGLAREGPSLVHAAPALGSAPGLHRRHERGSGRSPIPGWLPRLSRSRRG